MIRRMLLLRIYQMQAYSCIYVAVFGWWGVNPALDLPQLSWLFLRTEEGGGPPTRRTRRKRRRPQKEEEKEEEAAANK